jgi:hypothetical protein
MWSGMTTKNNLLKIRAIDTVWGDDTMTYLHSINTSGIALESYLKSVLGGSIGIKDTDDPINYRIYGEMKGNTKLVSYRADDMNRAGLNKSRFFMTFTDPLFSEVHEIVGMNDRYRVKVIDGPVQEGTNYTYECEAFGPLDKFIPASELAYGTLWSRDGASVPMTRSMKGAKASYTSPYAITFGWSSTRTERESGGDMANRPVAFAWKDEKGRTLTTWEHYDSWVNDLHFKELKNKTILWGRDNMNAQGGYDDKDRHSGEDVVQGPGLVQQMERANLNYYNDFDIDEFSDHIMRLRVGKNQTDKTHYVVSTGAYGLLQVHNALSIKARGWERVDNNEIFGDRENLGFGNSFRRYMHPSGFYVDFRLEPMLDDEYRTPVRHPKQGMARSYEYHIMDLGQTSGVDNIKLNYVKSAQDITGILKGMRDPYTPMGSEVVKDVATLKDGWVESRMSQFMVVLKNPNNTMIYRCNVQDNTI